LTTAALMLADSDAGKGSPIGLFVLLVLVVAVYFLWRSMNRHLKKVQQLPNEPMHRSGDDAPDAASPENRATPKQSGRG